MLKIRPNNCDLKGSKKVYDDKDKRKQKQINSPDLNRIYLLGRNKDAHKILIKITGKSALLCDY